LQRVFFIPSLVKENTYLLLRLVTLSAQLSLNDAAFGSHLRFLRLQSRNFSLERRGFILGMI
jgi:hypothetical protein